MGCNYFLRKKDNSKWTLPKSGIGKQLEWLLSDVVNNNTFNIDDGLLLDVKRCVVDVDELHIGKSSIGWNFSLCIYPTLGIYSLDDWMKLFYNTDEYSIVDECGNGIKPDDMVECITDRKSDNYEMFLSKEEFEKDALESINSFHSSVFKTEKHYNTYDEFLQDNNAIRGVKGLLKHKPNIWNPRDDERFQGFLPMFSIFFYTKDDKTYDMTTEWDFS